MTDLTLLELERLTRHPVDLTGFQPTSSNLITGKVEPRDSKEVHPVDVVDASFSKPVNRREFLAYSTSGLLALLLVGSGYGWMRSNKTAADISEGMAGIAFDVGSLSGEIAELQKAITECSNVISEFQNLFQQTSYSVSQLKDNLEITRNLYEQLDGMGITLTEIIEFIVNVISLIPNAGKYVQPINTILDVVKKTPETITVAEKAMTDLYVWFSNQQGQGVNNRLLLPALSVFFAINKDVVPTVEGLQNRIEHL